MGFATKAGKLSFGAQASKAALCAKKAKLVVISFEISAKSQKEITFYANKVGVETLLLQDIDIMTLSDAVGRKCGVLSVNDSSFANAIKAEMKMGGNVYDK